MRGSFLVEYMENDAKKKSGQGSSLLSILDEFSLLSLLKGKNYQQILSDFTHLCSNVEIIGRQRSTPKSNENDRFGQIMGKTYDTLKEKVNLASRSKELVDQYYAQFAKKYGLFLEWQKS